LEKEVSGRWGQLTCFTKRGKNPGKKIDTDGGKEKGEKTGRTAPCSPMSSGKTGRGKIQIMALNLKRDRDRKERRRGQPSFHNVGSGREVSKKKRDQ